MIVIRRSFIILAKKRNLVRALIASYILEFSKRALYIIKESIMGDVTRILYREIVAFIMYQF